MIEYPCTNPCEFCSGPLTVGELSDLIDEKPVAIIKMLMTDLGVMASMTQSLDPVTCIAVVQGFGKVVADLDETGFEGYVESVHIAYFCKL